MAQPLKTVSINRNAKGARMKTFTFMTTDEEFISLIKLIASFSLETGTPFWKNVGEVTGSFQTAGAATLLVKDEGDIIGYVHSYLISSNEMMISQAYNRNGGEDNLVAFDALEKAARERGIVKLLALVYLDPKVFEKYGLKFERYLLTKRI